MKHKIGFIGLGLIGGSIAKAIRLYHPDYELIAFDQNQKTLLMAAKEGIIDVSTAALDEHFEYCDYIFLCAPVINNTSYLKQLMPFLHKDCMVTDTGSVKISIHEEVYALGLGPNFIGGHPMAGSEKSGYENSKPLILENAYYILTPDRLAPQDRVDAFTAFIASLKALPVLLDYKEHDQITGTISHLPHIIAASLVNFVKDTDTRDALMKQLAAGGFKDITRIASSSATMWQHICLENKGPISHILSGYIQALQDAKTAIDSQDEETLYQLFDNAREYRSSILDASLGPIKKTFAVYCDIVDEAGGIATIATILASHNISLKNIGIIHNREFEEGVLRIEFYEDKASHEAAALLQKCRYIVYER